ESGLPLRVPHWPLFHRVGCVCVCVSVCVCVCVVRSATDVQCWSAPLCSQQMSPLRRCVCVCVCVREIFRGQTRTEITRDQIGLVQIGTYTSLPRQHQRAQWALMPVRFFAAPRSLDFPPRCLLAVSSVIIWMGIGCHLTR